jgi:hypothetical protein
MKHFDSVGVRTTCALIDIFSPFEFITLFFNPQLTLSIIPKVYRLKSSILTLVAYLRVNGSAGLFSMITNFRFIVTQSLKSVNILACFKNSDFGMMRSVIGYNKGDSEEVERAKNCIREILTATLDTGFVPYKASRNAVEEMMKRGDPNWVELVRRVKTMLDPNNIMNPGRYGDTSG